MVMQPSGKAADCNSVNRAIPFPSVRIRPSPPMGFNPLRLALRPQSKGRWDKAFSLNALLPKRRISCVELLLNCKGRPYPSLHVRRDKAAQDCRREDAYSHSYIPSSFNGQDMWLRTTRRKFDSFRGCQCQRSSIGESTCFIRKGLRVRVPPLVPRVRERFHPVRGCSSIGRAAAGSRKLGVRVSSASETARNIPIPFPVVSPTRR